MVRVSAVDLGAEVPPPRLVRARGGAGAGATVRLRVRPTVRVKVRARSRVRVRVRDWVRVRPSRLEARSAVRAQR